MVFVSTTDQSVSTKRSVGSVGWMFAVCDVTLLLYAVRPVGETVAAMIKTLRLAGWVYSFKLEDEPFSKKAT